MVHRLSWLRLVTSLTCLEVVAAEPDPARHADEAAVQDVARKFASAFESKDANALADLADRSSPRFADGAAALEKTLAALGQLKLIKTETRALTVAGSKATAEISLEAEVTVASKERQPPVRQSFNRTLELVKTDGGWKVWHHSVTETLFAAELLSGTVEERNQKLATKRYLLNPDLVRAVLRRGYDLTDRAKYEDATAAGTFGKDIAQQIGYQVGIVEALREMGGVHYAKHEYREALDLFQQSLKLAQQSDYKLGIAKGLTSVGNVQFRQGDLDHALENQQAALKLGEAIGDDESIGWALNGQAQVLQQQAKFDEALQIQERIVELRTRRGEKTLVAGALGNIGNIYYSQGRHAKALEYFNQTLDAARSAGMRTWIPLALNNIGSVYVAQGNYIEALQRFNESVKVAEEFGAKGQAADASVNIGNVYALQGDYEQALPFYERSRAIYEATGAQAPLAAVLIQTAHAFVMQHQYAKALEVGSKALELSEQMKSPLTIASASDTLGDIHKGQGNYREAEQLYKKALQLSEQVGSQPRIASSLTRLAKVYNIERDFKRAIDNANHAAEIAEETTYDDLLAEAQFVLGNAYRAAGAAEQSERAYLKAIAAIEKIRRRTVGNAQERERFFEAGVGPYYGLIGLLVDRGDHARALDVAEQMKGRVLLDALRSGHVDITRAMTPEELKKEESLNAKLASLNIRLAREASDKRRTAASSAALREELRKARLEYESFETDLYVAHPELRVQRSEIAIPKLDEIGALLSGGKRAALEFVIGTERSFLFALTPNRTGDDKNHVQIDVFPLKLEASAVSERVSQLRYDLLMRRSGYRSRATQLFQELIGPAMVRLAGVKELCIVPDGALWDLPFQALLSRSKKFLVQDFAVFYSPSLAVLREMIAARSKKTVANDSAQLMAIGNPSVSQEMAKLVQVAHRDEALVPLPDAEREVEALRQLYGQKRSAIFTESNAREEEVKAEAGKYRVIHFATHGRLDDRSPLYSHLVLAAPKEGSKEDGLLEAWEVMKMDLLAELAVLSACETARGRIGAGEGVIGMSWAFFVAGVPTTVVSHWKVESASTTELMVAFHKNLTSASSGNVISKAEALRRAELQLLAKKRFQHPFYWASFSVVGDGT